MNKIFLLEENLYNFSGHLGSYFDGLCKITESAFLIPFSQLLKAELAIFISSSKY